MVTVPPASEPLPKSVPPVLPSRNSTVPVGVGPAPVTLTSNCNAAPYVLLLTVPLWRVKAMVGVSASCTTSSMSPVPPLSCMKAYLPAAIPCPPTVPFNVGVPVLLPPTTWMTT